MCLIDVFAVRFMMVMSGLASLAVTVVMRGIWIFCSLDYFSLITNVLKDRNVSGVKQELSIK